MIHKNIFLLLGSNLGDRTGNLKRSMRELQDSVGGVVKQSGLYETSAWGKADQPNFLNLAIQLETSLDPFELLKKILSMEESMGRIRKEKWDSRIIDIDVIYFGNEVISTDELIVPHPHLTQRRFVLVPLTEISPNFVHPVLKKTNAELLKTCTDPLMVKFFIS